MASLKLPPRKLFHAFILISLFSLFLAAAISRDQLKTTYIVLVKNSAAGEADTTRNYHKSFVSDHSLIYSYNESISGFSATLTLQELEALKGKPGFISARPERTYELLTTYSPAFLGLKRQTGVWKSTNEGKGIIIGVLDSGIYPGHPSFRDKGMPSPSSKWKGGCLPKKYCNRKLIGARGFLMGNNYSSPLDLVGHGTHTASTAAGAFVPNVSIIGNAAGTASGVAPGAYVSAYRVCTAMFCRESDILAGMDAAISDGVDVLSMSLGTSSGPFYKDIIAIGAFAAVKKGIFVSMSAGNGGPYASTVMNDAPWLLTVGASTIDRRLVGTAKLGNGTVFDGESVYQPTNLSSQVLLPLIYCQGSLVGFDVNGKIVLRDGKGNIEYQAQEVRAAGGAAMIVANVEDAGYSREAFFYDLPSLVVSYSAGQQIKDYIKSTPSPTAMILFNGTKFGDRMAPAVSFFSSRGPSLLTPGVGKPDIVGPGENILAAWSRLDPNNPGTMFKMDSGTSMSCPHLSGVGALVKSAHPDWSVAAVKSAIMTTAYLVNTHGIPILDEKLTPANLYATGAGHVNVTSAMDPGLVYDIAVDDYVQFLCGLGYTEDQVETITQEPTNCSRRISQGQLNYPTFSVTLGQSTTFSRTVMNVGKPGSCYSVKVFEPMGVKVVVKPSKMCFKCLKQKATYYVTFSRLKKRSGGVNNNISFAQGSLLWESETNMVRSVIAVSFSG